MSAGGRDGRVYREVGRTETVKDNLNPRFAKQFIMDFHFEEVQHLQFAVYDRDSTSEAVSTHDFIGRAQTTMGNLMGRRGQQLTLPLTGTSRKGNPTITVKGSEVSGGNDLFVVHFAGVNLDKKDLFGKSDPFLQVNR